MGRFFALLLLPLLLFGGTVKHFKWKDGESFLTFLERKKLPLRVYYNLDKEDQNSPKISPIPLNAKW